MAEVALAEAERVERGDAVARTALELSVYYEAARELSHRLTSWSKKFDPDERRFVVCTGGGPGIMEAANRGASEAKGLNIGLTISIPNDEFDNPYVSRELHLHFSTISSCASSGSSILLRRLCCSLEVWVRSTRFFEMLTLVQTGKMKKHMPIVLFGTKY